jgi:transcription initiation factor TFIIIB Brf1 subunit/transcription initiation factor TFIIB
MKIEGIDILCDSDFENALLIKASRIMGVLGLTPDIVGKYQNYVRQDMAIIKNGKSPQGVVAARIYQICLLSNNTRTQEAIAEVAGTSEGTIQAIFHKMNERRQE